mmetsp:Transcript_31349/g.86178  ORF Transcript_31349/g.86178 Transcript_31349/m.86178 type:complete len:179 (-) Transcript_31349:2-538(-)
MSTVPTRVHRRVAAMDEDVTIRHRQRFVESVRVAHDDDPCEPSFGDAAGASALDRSGIRFPDIGFTFDHRSTLPPLAALKVAGEPQAARSALDSAARMATTPQSYNFAWWPQTSEQFPRGDGGTESPEAKCKRNGDRGDALQPTKRRRGATKTCHGGCYGWEGEAWQRLAITCARPQS